MSQGLHWLVVAWRAIDLRIDLEIPFKLLTEMNSSARSDCEHHGMFLEGAEQKKKPKTYKSLQRTLEAMDPGPGTNQPAIQHC